MKKQKENPLFAQQLNVDFIALKEIDIAHATTWSQIEMQCAIHGIEITYDLFKVFLMSAGLFANMFKIMLKCIEKTDFLTEFAGNDEIADIIYCMSNHRLINLLIIYLTRNRFSTIPIDILFDLCFNYKFQP